MVQCLTLQTSSPRAAFLASCGHWSWSHPPPSKRTALPRKLFLLVPGRATGREQPRTYERGRPFSTSPPPAGQEEDRATAAASTAATTDSDSVEDAPKQILLYEAGSKRLLRISSATATMNGFFWSFYVGVLEAAIPTTTWEPWGYVGLGCTALMFAVSHTFSKHWVSRVSYFPEWRLISVATHTFFGVGGTVLPSVKAKAIYRPFKVKGDFFFSLLDKEDGVFHNRELLMRLLSATPGGDVALHQTADGDEPASPTKAKQPWKKRKRGGR
eukprot:jgi/Undpi1/5956/HiC_scaffold_2.g01230.m1